MTQAIRKLDFGKLNIGGSKSSYFFDKTASKTILALEIPFFEDKNFPEVLKKQWNSNDFEGILKEALDTNCDLISIKFNVREESQKEDIEKILNNLDRIEKILTKPVIYRGANNKNIDTVLLPKIAKALKKQSIIAFADDLTYESITSVVAKTEHCLVLRSPIDINLAKELNILAIDSGMNPDRLLIDTDMGGLGYGLDYGFSIIEKIIQAGIQGDKMLNMPIIVFAGEEVYRAKEAKANTFSDSWGDFENRAKMWEISTATALVSAGVHICVLWNKNTIKVLKEVL